MTKISIRFYNDCRETVTSATRTSPYKRSNKTLISLQRYPICGFAFLGVDEVGVDLGCADALVGEHL